MLHLHGNIHNDIVPRQFVFELVVAFMIAVCHACHGLLCNPRLLQFLRTRTAHGHRAVLSIATSSVFLSGKEQD